MGLCSIWRSGPEREAPTALIPRSGPSPFGGEVRYVTHDNAPDPKTYLSEPEFDGPQDDQALVDGLVFQAHGLITPTAPNSLEEANAWFRGQIAHRSQDWTNGCQKFSRTGPGCPGGNSSALEAFFNCPREYRIVGGDVTKLEPGWQAVSRSQNSGSTMAKFGHIFPIDWDFGDGSQAGISTDALRRGYPDRISPTALYDRWGHDYVGAVRWQNGLILDIKDPKPEQTEKYERLADSLVDCERALRDLRVARDKAKTVNDWKDRDEINALIQRQLALKRDIASTYDRLRRIPG